ncbi:MAG: DUF305 domain-containing protein [Nocardioides sp.]
MITRHRIKSVAAAGVMTLTLSAGLTACGDDSSGARAVAPTERQTASNGDVFNGADLQFATDMIPHHAQAIEMVTLTDGRPLDPEVEKLANAIRDAQGPEVEIMVDWLTAWDQEVPETSIDHANAGHDTGDRADDSAAVTSDLPGMMSEDDMDALADAPDKEFQALWLQMMTEHHTGAIEIAKVEQENGEFPDAITLAESIRAGQADEIAQLESWLGS